MKNLLKIGFVAAQGGHVALEKSSTKIVRGACPNNAELSVN